MPTGHDYNELEVIKILKNKGYKLLGKYINSKEKISIVDKYGYKYYGTFFNLKNNKNNKPFSLNNIYTIDNIKTWIKINNLNNDIELLSDKYISATSKLLWKCKKCETVFERDWHYMKRETTTSKICKKCNRNNLTKKQTHFDSYKDFELYGYKVLGAYNGKHKKCTLIDNKGYLYYTSYNCFYSNDRKPLIYSIFNPYTIYNIEKTIKDNNIPIKLISEEFLGGDIPLEWECKCGNHFFDICCNVIHTPTGRGRNSKYRRTRCEKCSKSQSNLSYLTEEYLKNININYKKEYRFNDCRDKIPLPFDYAIFIDSKLYGLIEVDGEQHYHPYSFNSNKSYKEKLQQFEYTKQHDNIKDNYCKRNKIRLLRIPYYEFNSKNDYKNKINNFLNI